MSEKMEKKAKLETMHNELTQNSMDKNEEVFGFSLEQPSFLKIVDSSSSCHSESPTKNHHQ
ncbi:MAG: hypothetical protein ACPHLK_02295 [Gammaproteobacteria bacterium]|jgi:hypothetical protein